MSETILPSFTFVKSGILYFSRRIPAELKSHYTAPRIAVSLRTRSSRIAEARAGVQLINWTSTGSIFARSPRNCRGSTCFGCSGIPEQQWCRPRGSNRRRAASRSPRRCPSTSSTRG
ncbi:DUF6538 domain-containing protein [Salipiger sp. 1_MG-2023]|uniref:DUF6538 domain-containing protein n=1 Tax=Salipiger sp. 1_MG-2023 TaxID=3062665 RepID=UPI0034C6641E